MPGLANSIGLPFFVEEHQATGAPVINNAILLEDGVNFIELEDNSGVILLDG